MQKFWKRAPQFAGIVISAAIVSACGGGGDASPPPAAAPAPGVVDTTAPTVGVTNNLGAAAATGPMMFTFTFSESVGSSFTADDITVTGGVKGAFTMVSDTVATLMVTPTANTTGTITVDVTAGKFSDAANNSNTAAVSASHAFNTVVAPTPITTAVYSFDEATAPVLTGFGGAENSSVVADPTNAANKVLRIEKSATAELWAGTTVSMCANNASPTLPFSASNKTMSVRFNSPDAGAKLRVKVENASDATQSVETESVEAVVAGWQVLTFNFANQASGTAALNTSTTYNKISLFPNFGVTGTQAGAAKTYYIDDVKFNGASFSVVCASTGGGTSSTPGAISFDESTAPVLTGFGGAEDSSVVVDPAGGTNKVARVVKGATAELWAGTTISNLAGQTIAPIAFSASYTTVSVKVWSPDAGIPVRLKVENAADSTKSVETETSTTVANAWQTLTFNFANQASGTAALNLATSYNKMSIFFNFGQTGVQAGSAKTYYLDDVSYTAGSVTPPASSTLPVTFDNTAVTYTLTGFGGAEDSSVVVDPAGGANKVARVAKSATAELWAGTTLSTGANQSIATVPFTASAKTMTLRVWAPTAGVPIRLKLEDAADNTHTVETEAVTTVANAWQTLTFNFANQAPGTALFNLAYTYNKASVFPNFGTTGAAGGGGTYYFDDLTFVP
jgi:Bacterial Ig-like domain